MLVKRDPIIMVDKGWRGSNRQTTGAMMMMVMMTMILIVIMMMMMMTMITMMMTRARGSITAKQLVADIQL